MNFIESKGERIEIEGIIAYGSTEIFIGEYTLIEESSGFKLTSGKNKTEAIQKAKEAVSNLGIDKIKSIIDNNVKKHGLSPLLQAV